MMRYSLRTLLCLVALCAIVIALVRANKERERKYEAARSGLEDQGFRLSGKTDVDVYDYTWSWDKITSQRFSDLGRVNALSLWNAPPPSFPGLGRLLSLPGLRKVAFYDGAISNEDWGNLSAINSLKELELHGTAIPFDRLNSLCGIPTLQRLCLEYYHWGKQSVIQRIDIPMIRSLRTLEVQVPAELKVPSMPQLKTAVLGFGSAEYNIWGSVYLETCENLETLTVGNANSRPFRDVIDGLLQPVEVKHLSGIACQPSLKTLIIDGGWLAANDAREVRRIGSISKLTIKYATMSELSLVELGQLNQLKDLEIIECDLRDEVSKELKEDNRKLNWSNLRKCRSLERLMFHVDVESPSDLSWLSEMRHLRSLDLSGIKSRWSKADRSTLVRSFKISRLPDLKAFSFLSELVVGEIDLPEEEVQTALPNTKVAVPSLETRHE